jgi:hypothetical protein
MFCFNVKTLFCLEIFGSQCRGARLPQHPPSPSPPHAQQSAPAVPHPSGLGDKPTPAAPPGPLARMVAGCNEGCSNHYVLRKRDLRSYKIGTCQRLLSFVTQAYKPCGRPRTWRPTCCSQGPEHVHPAMGQLTRCCSWRC